MTTEMSNALAELARPRQTELDERISAWRQGPGGSVRLWCGAGCGNCCTLAVNATLAEALAIASLLDDVQRGRIAATADKILVHASLSADPRAFLSGYRQAVGPCPFIDRQSNCTIHAHRPLACRALLATRPADWCGLNLAELPEMERDSFLASLDQKVVAWPTHYAAAPQELAAHFERDLIFAMIRFTGFGVTGNLPLLVWLSGQEGFDEALTDGIDTFLALLASHQINQPFLVQVDVP